MPGFAVQPLGSFATGSKTATASTAFAIPIFPYGGMTGTPLATRNPHQATAARVGIIHITTVQFVQATTANLQTWMRPLNWTYFTAVGAASQAVVTLNADPGLYSASRWRGGGMTANATTAPSAADTAVASGDYCIYQATSGQWVMDTAAGTVSAAGALTMTTNLPTGGVSVGGLFYWFGPPGANTDPATNLACPTYLPLVAATIQTNTDANGLMTTLFTGDPMIFYTPNATTALAVQNICGYYSKN